MRRACKQVRRGRLLFMLRPRAGPGTGPAHPLGACRYGPARPYPDARRPCPRRTRTRGAPVRRGHSADSDVAASLAIWPSTSLGLWPGSTALPMFRLMLSLTPAQDVLPYGKSSDSASAERNTLTFS